MQIPKTLQDIVDRVTVCHGRALLVGGAVRDMVFTGAEPKDFDIEIHGLNVDTVQSILSDFGDVKAVGESFGVLKLVDDEGNDFDISLPRRESKQGRGHKGFMVALDETMTPKEAASRRDFTINSMMFDLATGELDDPFNGRADLEAGILRHTSDAFADDSLRVLRGVQFAGRFGLTMAPETVELCASLADNVRFVEEVDPDSSFEEIAIDRVFGEFWKLATKSTVPSAGLRVLKDTGWIKLFPELNALDGLEQDAQWHPEGNVWVHTLHTVDAAMRIAARDKLNEDDRAILFFGALLHDVGKPLVTKVIDGRIRSPKHDKAGEKLAKSFLERFRSKKAKKDSGLIKAVVALVGEHMVHVGADITPRLVRRLSDRIDGKTDIMMVSRIIEADHGGRPPLSAENPAPELVRLAKELAVERSKPTPFLTGKHLIAIGLKPGAIFGRILKEAYELQLSGDICSEKEALSWLQSRNLS